MSYVSACSSAQEPLGIKLEGTETSGIRQAWHTDDRRRKRMAGEMNSYIRFQMS
jgi:hypothetical protein